MPLQDATSQPRRACRGMTGSTFEEITTDEPHKPLIEPMKRGSGRNNQGRITVRHRGGGDKRTTASSTSSATRSAFRPGSRRSSTTRTARPASPCSTTATARSATSCCPTASRSATSIVSGPEAEARVGNALPIANIPLGTTIHNIELMPGQGRPDRPLRRRRRPAAGQGGRLRPGPAAVGRGAPGEHQVHGHDRPGRQPRPREPEPRQGRSRPAHGPAARGPRRRR